MHSLLMKKGLILLLVLISGGIQAQDTYKFGDVPEHQMEMTVYEKDSSANAVVLFEVGELEISYQVRKFVKVLHYHKRMKILSDEGLDAADVSISFRHQEPKERVRGIKAISYTYSKDGKVVKQELDKDNIHTVEVTDYWSEIRFSIPGVKKGSVIEFSYEINSDNILNISDWYFMQSIPVMWSEYTVAIPDIFGFIITTKGDTPFFIQERDEKSIGLGQNELDGVEHVFVMKDMPAYPDEPFVRGRIDYLDHIEFQFSGLRVPGSMPVNYLKSWDELVNKLIDDDEYGARLRDEDLIKETVQQQLEGTESNQEKMIAIYNYVSNNVEWNGNYRMYLREKLSTYLEDGSVHSSAVNMLLIQMLREAGLVSYPVLVSTRASGLVNKIIPAAEQFNHTVAYVEIDSSAIILDATDKDRPYDILPTSITGSEGLLVYKDQTIWVPISSSSRNISLITLIMKLDENGGMNGTSLVQNRGIYAVNSRSSYDVDDPVVSLKDHLFGAESFLNVDSVLSVVDDFEKGFRYELAFSQEGESEADILYINPMIIEKINENPFKRSERFFPIDYRFIQNKVITMNMEIPEGWRVDELPQSVIHRLPDNSGEFQRIIQPSDGGIMLRYVFRINKDIFDTTEYENLKAMYDQMVVSLGENIVLKKGE